MSLQIAMAAAAAPSVATSPSPSPSPAPAPKVASPKAGDRKVVPADAVEVEVELKLELEEKHVLAVDDSSVDRAVIAKILRSSKYRGEQSTQFFLDWFITTWKEG